MKMAPKYDVSAAIQPNLYDINLAIALDIKSAFNSLTEYWRDGMTTMQLLSLEKQYFS